MSRPSIRLTIKDRDTGWRKLFTLVKRLVREKPALRVGVLASEHDARAGGQGPSNVELATIHEFGAPAQGIPERSFLRSTFDANQAKYARMEEALALRMVQGGVDERKALGLLGQVAVSDIRAAITTGTGIAPSLAPETIRRKGSSRPLVDTGQLVGAITWSLENGEER